MSQPRAPVPHWLAAVKSQVCNDHGLPRFIEDGGLHHACSTPNRQNDFQYGLDG